MRCTISFPLPRLSEASPRRQSGVGEISLPLFVFWICAGQLPTVEKNRPTRPVRKRESGGSMPHSREGTHCAQLPRNKCTATRKLRTRTHEAKSLNTIVRGQLKIIVNNRIESGKSLFFCSGICVHFFFGGGRRCTRIGAFDSSPSHKGQNRRCRLTPTTPSRARRRTATSNPEARARPRAPPSSS
jgi:hypothetical protein